MGLSLKRLRTRLTKVNPKPPNEWGSNKRGNLK